LWYFSGYAPKRAAAYPEKYPENTKKHSLKYAWYVLWYFSGYFPRFMKKKAYPGVPWEI
jgi:hypothetical protein